MALRRAVVLGIWLAGVSLHAQTDPGWWTPGVVGTGTANSYGPINLGQLMNLADQARIHLDTEAGAVGGAGPDIENMVASWPDAPATAYSPANLGQLKAIADAFYTRLDALGFDYQTQINNNGFGGTWTGTPLRPWIDTTPAATNYAIANIGQAKMLFSWDLTKGLLHAINATMTLDEDTVGTITLGCLGAGTGPATYQILTGPSHGMAVLDGGTVSYYPNTHFNGTDSFTFQAAKGGPPNTGTISIVVNPVDDAPLVNVGPARSVTLPGTLSLTGKIQDIDTAAGNITHTWVKVSGPGEVTFTDVGSVAVSGDTSTITTTASFSVAGSYVLRLMASDATSVRSDSLLATVNAAGATVPTVTLASLSSSYAFGTPISLQATASVGGGATITKVEFYEGSRKLGDGTLSGGTYTLTWTPTHLGVYNVTAVATSSTNAQNSSTGQIARIFEGNWFVDGGAGNEGYSGTGGTGGAIPGSTTGASGGSTYAPGSGANGGGGAAGAGGNGSGSADSASKDTDGDGAMDIDDAYPNDPRRKQDVPVKTYAVIDLSGAVQDDSDVEQVAIGNDGQIAFAFWSSNTELKVGKWKDGAMVEAPKTTGSKISFLTPGTHIVSDTYVYEKGDPFQMNSRGSVAFHFGGSWAYGQTADFTYSPSPREGTIYGLSESGSALYAVESEIAIVPIGGSYTSSLSITSGNDSQNGIDMMAMSRDGKVAAGGIFYHGSSFSYDFVCNTVGTWDYVTTRDLSPNTYFGSINSAGQVTYYNFDTNKNFIYYGGSGVSKELWAETTTDFARQITPQPNQILRIRDDKLGSIWATNLEGPGLGVDVWRQFLVDTDATHVTPDNKWPIYVAHFPDGWSKSKIANAASLPIPGQAGINLLACNSSGFLIATGYKTLDQAGNFIPEAQQRLHALALIPCDIVPDANRDGKIDDKDRGKITKDNPWHWWINDDNDSGEAGGDSTPGSNSPNYATDHIDGVKDLTDWFPVFLDIKQMLNVLTPDKFDYVLRSKTGNLHFVYTDLAPSDAKKYLKDVTTARQYAAKEVNLNPGAPIPATFLDSISNDGKGIVLIEGCAKSEDLILDVYDESNPAGGPVASVSMPLKVDGIEKMYRSINIMAADNGASGGRPTDLGEPENYPDKLCIKKNFVLVHGYNVNPEQARGWNAEMFKDLWWADSRARFYGVTWHGSESQIANQVTINYHLNVNNAFASAHALTSFLPAEGETVVAAHSLGNMVVGSAINDWGAGPKIKQYFMIDAAVAIEAYDGAATKDPNMVHEYWSGPPYAERLWSTEWYNNTALAANDGRRALTWRDRLKAVTKVNTFNFYSSGEEVLAAPDPTTPSNIGGAGGILYTAVFTNNPAGEKVWTLQEKLKGRTLDGEIIGSVYGGWGFNTRWIPPLSPSDCNLLTDTQLVTDPIFKPQIGGLHDAANGGTYATQNRNQLLAEMFPARTRAAGGNEVVKFSQSAGEQRNFDMFSPNFQNDWPSGRPDKRWLHSDVNNAAFTFTWKLFDKFKTLGKLDE